MSGKQTHDGAILGIVTAASRRHLRRSLVVRASWGGMVIGLVLGHGTSSLAGPPEDAVAKAVVRFEPLAAPPPFLENYLREATSPIHVAGTPQGTLYATTDKAGKARVWLVRNNAIVADVTAPSPREHMNVDWPGTFAFWLGPLPVVAISWKFGPSAYGNEDLGLWAAEGGGRFLGGLPQSNRSPCKAGENLPGKDCGRCGSSGVIPIDARLAGVENDRARFVQQLAATWYYYFDAAAETFEQDYLLTAKGLVPDGQARRTHNTISLPQAKERVKGLLRDYFTLAKGQSRESIAPEFLTCFEQLVDLAPDFAKGHYNVGCMNALLGNRKQAVASVTKALVLEPKYRKLARKDPDLDSVRDDPELTRVLAEPGSRVARTTGIMDVDAIARELRSSGFVAVENSLSPELRARLSDACRESAADSFLPAAVGRGKPRTHDAGVRGDVIKWLDDAEVPDRSFLAVMEELRVGLNERLYLGLLDYECHYAIFGAGAHYDKHRDSLSGQKNRLLSTVVYLNDEWAPSDGGELVRKLYGALILNELGYIVPTQFAHEKGQPVSLDMPKRVAQYLPRNRPKPFFVVHSFIVRSDHSRITHHASRILPLSSSPASWPCSSARFRLGRFATTPARSRAATGLIRWTWLSGSKNRATSPRRK